MKRVVKVLRFTGILILIISLRFVVVAQEGTFPSTVSGNERSINLLHESSSAPVGNGLAFFIALGAGFLIFRYARIRQDIHEEVQHDF